jgi:V-type H+-transporting ATPase subunit E
LRDSEVFVYCRKEDASFVKMILKEIETQYNKNNQDEIQTKITLIDSGDHFLTCVGGVHVTSLNDKIKVNNTIEERVDICFQEMIPDIRKILFPK